MNISRKLMNENSMRAVKTDIKQIIINTSRAVAYFTLKQYINQSSYFFSQAVNKSNV